MLEGQDALPWGIHSPPVGVLGLPVLSPYR